MLAETCRHGHPRTPENTYVKTDGRSFCKVCNAEATRRSYARRVKGLDIPRLRDLEADRRRAEEESDRRERRRLRGCDVAKALRAERRRRNPRRRVRDEARRTWERENRAAIRAKVRALKGTVCWSCGGEFVNSSDLHFHHRDPSTKSFTIGDEMGRSRNWEKLEAEIAKCDVLCIPCHRERHGLAEVAA